MKKRERKYINNIPDKEHSVFSLETVSGVSNVSFTLNKNSHINNGRDSYPKKGYVLLDKDNLVYFIISNVNKNKKYRHIITLLCVSNEIIKIQTNISYVILPTIKQNK